jgi:flagellar hook-associated protein 2
MAGIGIIGASGIDTGSLINGLVSAAAEPVRLLQQRAAEARAVSSRLSGLGTTLASLRSTAASLDTTGEVASFRVSQSSASAFTATTDGAASAGTYAIDVRQLATEQRTYSKAIATSSSSSALGLAGTFTLGVGGGDAKELTVNEGDSLESIASRINGLGLRMQAGVFQESDGKFRLQLRGLDTGAANELRFGVSGSGASGNSLSDVLGLAGTGASPDDGRTVQRAQNAVVSVDGFAVERSTNRITGAVQGLTLDLREASAGKATTVSVATDTNAVFNKVSAFVGAYNGVVKSVNELTGIGSAPAAVPQLSGDSTLRSIVRDLQSSVQDSGAGQAGGLFGALRDVGVSIDRDGLLTLDNDKLTRALTTDAASVQKLFARPVGASSGGVMASVRDAVDSITSFTSGRLQLRKSTFDDRAKKADEAAAKQQSALEGYAERLRKQFTAMDDRYAQNMLLGSAMSRIV